MRTSEKGTRLSISDDGSQGPKKVGKKNRKKSEEGKKKLTERRRGLPARPVPQEVRRQADLVGDPVDVRQRQQARRGNLRRRHVRSADVPRREAGAGLLRRAQKKELAADGELGRD